MTTVQTIITKADVIKALKTERLDTGAFFREEWCSVCAVGAVLRKCGVPDDNIGNVGHRMQRYTESKHSAVLDDTAKMKDVTRLIKADCWLAALSAYYEGVAKGDREKTIAFVKERFPAKLDVTNIVANNNPDMWW